ncbi:hypothetical protein OGATHE_000641 [Ogataea polymorpha]|uniref:Uncharacterized protein n=1 Tax=Ogataea polymorpha TaxID=460523 RepID=A0A9P8TGH3_9ASCO|nr:hypothetical protein OGATHE_000641 [Ogataea polymorpha]
MYPLLSDVGCLEITASLWNLKISLSISFTGNPTMLTSSDERRFDIKYAMVSLCAGSLLVFRSKMNMDTILYLSSIWVFLAHASMSLLNQLTSLGCSMMYLTSAFVVRSTCFLAFVSKNDFKALIASSSIDFFLSRFSGPVKVFISRKELSPLSVLSRITMIHFSMSLAFSKLLTLGSMYLDTTVVESKDNLDHS